MSPIAKACQMLVQGQPAAEVMTFLKSHAIIASAIHNSPVTLLHFLDKIFTDAKLEGDKALQVYIRLCARKYDQGERGTLPVCTEGDVFYLFHFDFTFFF